MKPKCIKEEHTEWAKRYTEWAKYCTKKAKNCKCEKCKKAIKK